MRRPDVAPLDEDVKGKPVTPFAETLQRLQIPFAILSGYDRSLTGDEILVKAARLQTPTPLSAIRQALSELCTQLGCRSPLDQRLMAEACPPIVVLSVRSDG